jgi:hypothetical protein
MRKINKMMAMVMLAVMMSLGTQSAFASTGILIGDRQVPQNVKPMGLVDMLVVYMKSGIVVGSREGIVVGSNTNSRDGIILTD